MAAGYRAQLILLTTDSGVPLFKRNCGDIKEELSFAEIGALNGVHLFSRLRKVDLQTTRAGDNCFYWKVHKDSLTSLLIVDHSDFPDKLFSVTCDLIFELLVMAQGLANLEKNVHPGNFKRDVKPFLPAIDELISVIPFYSCSIPGTLQWEPWHKVHSSLHDVFETFADSIQTSYAFTTVNKRLLYASKSFIALPEPELLLLTLVAANSELSSYDYKVFLTKTSPTLPLRFVSIQLMPNIKLSFLCDDSRSLDSLQQMCGETFKDHLDYLTILANQSLSFKSILLSPIRGKQIHAVDNSIFHGLLGLSYVDQQSRSVTFLPHKRLQKSMLKEIFEGYFSLDFDIEEDDNIATTFKEGETESVNVMYKSYIMFGDAEDSYRMLFVAYTLDTPTFALRSLAQKILEIMQRAF